MRATVLVSAEPVWALDLAARWAADGDDVTAVLLDAAAVLARADHVDADAVAAARQAGVALAAHDEALRRRAIVPGAGIAVVDLDAVADLVTDGADRVVWL